MGNGIYLFIYQKLKLHLVINDSFLIFFFTFSVFFFSQKDIVAVLYICNNSIMPNLNIQDVSSLALDDSNKKISAKKNPGQIARTLFLVSSILSTGATTAYAEDNIHIGFSDQKPSPPKIVNNPCNEKYNTKLMDNWGQNAHDLNFLVGEYKNSWGKTIFASATLSPGDSLENACAIVKKSMLRQIEESNRKTKK